MIFGFDPLLLLVLALVLAAEFVNGWTDAPNAIATVVSTRVMAPRTAIAMATLLNVIGTLTGTAVAATIGKDIVDADVIDLVTIGSAMVGIVTWSTIAWKFGLPTSESHALVSGLAGAGLATAGPHALLWAGWQKVLLGLVFSTFFGFFGGAIIVTLIYRWFARRPIGTVRRLFGNLQIYSAAFMAFGHGTNDGQKFIGAFSLALLLGGVIQEFRVDWWVMVLCSMVMGIGTSVGGWRIIKTMGMRMVKLEPFQGFAAETGAAMAIQTASVLGIPLSTTHTINTSIMGVGAAHRISAVRWGVVREVVLAWILTFPICGFIAWSIATLARIFFPR